jgi:hypothetical protein
MFFDAIGEAHPAFVSTTVHTMVVPGEPASNTIWWVVWPAVIVPPESVHWYVEPVWFGALAEAPDAPTGTDSGEAICGSGGTGLTVTVTVGLFVDGQEFAAVTVSV